MKTSFDAVDILWSNLNGSAFDAALTGGIYKRRPAGSDKEDAVINALPITNQQLQNCIVNLNIYVPNLVIEVNGVQDSTQPNFPRLKALTALAIATIKGTWGSDFNYDVQQQNLIRDQETGEHYSNIRIEFFIENL